MSEEQTTKRKRKRFTNFFTLYFILVVFAFSNYAFSKYTATTQSTTSLQVAKFNIAVNGADILQQEKFDLLLSSTNEQDNYKLVPDSQGYFEIVINPTGTHVSLEYEIAFDLTKINSEIINENNEKRNIVLTGYSIDNGITILDISEDYVITGEINLKENSTGFKEEDKIILRVYWEWKQDIVNPTFENQTIEVTSTVKQKISNGSETYNE